MQELNTYSNNFNVGEVFSISDENQRTKYCIVQTRLFYFSKSYQAEKTKTFVVVLWITSLFSILIGLISNAGVVIITIKMFDELILYETITIFISNAFIILSGVMAVFAGMFVCMIRYTRGYLYFILYINELNFECQKFFFQIQKLNIPCL